MTNHISFSFSLKSTDFFLSSLLPPLEIGHVPSLGFAELKELLYINLTREDWRKVIKLLRLIDIENLRAFWAHDSFDPRGNVNENEMEKALLEETWPSGQEFPAYLQDYLAKYQTQEERLYHFPQLFNQFFLHEGGNEEGFLRDYFQFQREMRLVMTGFRAKKLKKDIAKELQYEDASDPIVAQILAQKDAKHYEPPFEYKELKPIFEQYENSPLELNKAIYDYQFNTLVEIWGGELFNINRILNYLARLILVDKWLELDLQKGMRVIDRIEKGIQ